MCVVDSKRPPDSKEENYILYSNNVLYSDTMYFVKFCICQMEKGTMHWTSVRVHAEGGRGAATDKEAPPRRTGARPLLPRHAAAVSSVGSVAGLQLHAACEPQLVSANRWS